MTSAENVSKIIDIIINNHFSTPEEAFEALKKKDLLPKKLIKKEKRSTNQLKSEDNHRGEFKCEMCSAYGLEIIIDWGSGSKNKKEDCDADYTVKIIDLKKFNQLECAKNLNVKEGSLLTISLKTKGGNFTIANGGTELGSVLFDSMIPKKNTELRKEFNMMLSNIKAYKKELGKNKRWDDIGQSKKKYIKETLCDFYFELFQIREYANKLYEWLGERTADLKCVGNKIFIPEEKNLQETYKVKRDGDDSIIVGHYKLRVKAGGGRVDSSWKINYEFNQ